MKTLQLKSGIPVMIREATKENAQRMIEFYNIVGGETDFLSFGENEFTMPLIEYENFIETTKQEQNSIILVATIEEEIVSIASITSNQKAKSKHVGTLGIVVAQKYCGLGLGRILMDTLIEWAISNGITKKISLVTTEHNHRAIELYKKVGFEEEGLLKKDNYVNGTYYNTLVMGLIL
ncbi:GNAT family N-acetyltransferase [Bacillus sp. 165]|uniref:GNAT family N-acetyltransferase n=1 Tax=Bacillus sp. 165 TaxID=1529117 RepID=UPI001ADBF988|nr:GNAT family N-acetyltransferase [Bacillus sp. 165]MBO9129256.1 GNAT family N-acetyltransferase [Bacillus sp. 165]